MSEVEPGHPGKAASAPLLGGKYLLLHQLAVGGMAEIFLAQSVGPVGFDKLVVIKRILPEYAKNPEYQRMFVDEARLASSMSHPNVVQCFDLGDSPQGLYLVMEYLAGQDVKNLVRVARKREQHLGLDFAVRIVSGAADGLHYAHHLTGVAGKSLNLVHRDVTPSNLFVTWDGGVKVLDFGIAQAEMRLSKTQAGAVKGKFQYMSPEQIRAEPLDGRVDQFALGAVLFELLTGHKLFRADNELALITSILSPERQRVTDVRGDLPAHLDHIVVKATSVDREQRYRSMTELRDELNAVLRTWETSVVSRDPANVVRSLFPVEYEAHRKLLAELPRSTPEQLERLLQASIDTRSGTSSGSGSASAGSNSSGNSAVMEARRLTGETARRQSLMARVGIGAAIVLVGLLVMWVATRKPPVQLGLIEVSSEPSGATVLLDGVEEQWKTPMVISDVPLGVHELRVTHPDMQERKHEVRLTAESASVKVKAVLTPVVGTLHVATTPREVRLVVDGRLISGLSPFTVDELQLDRAHRIEVSADGYQPESRDVDGNAQLVQIDLTPLPPEPVPVVDGGRERP